MSTLNATATGTAFDAPLKSRETTEAYSMDSL